ncbi:hypothetical protein ACHQM5_019298 [Ranunculus cassubicifolius]
MCSISSYKVIRPGKQVQISAQDYSTSKYRVAQVLSVPNKPIFHQELLKCRTSHSDLHLKEIIDNHSKVNYISKGSSWGKHESREKYLEEAYERCRLICSSSAKSYYLGSLLFSDDRRKAIWGLYAWCRSADEIVDGPNISTDNMNDELEKWEKRLHDIFNGKPHDIFDVALADTVDKFSMDIKPFKDMIEGMRMDTWKSRYENFEELYQYCYYVAGTVGLMTVPLMGIPLDSDNSVEKVYNGALYSGIANQLTNILRDVGEDALRGRVYLPQDELARFGLSDKDVLSMEVTDKWREFMKFQIERARFYYSIAEEGTTHVEKANGWPLRATLSLYQKILDEIEDNDYDNLTKKASVGKIKKLLVLPLAYIRSIFNA